MKILIFEILNSDNEGFLRLIFLINDIYEIIFIL